jgi:hypothetical protein
MRIEAIEFLDRMKGTLPELITTSDLETLNTGLRFLFSGLRRAFGLRQSKDHGRAGVRESLVAIWRFIALFKQPFSESLYVPLIVLESDLDALDRGTVAPMLRRAVRRSGRASSTQVRAGLRGYAAGTAARLVEYGVSREQQANDQVAKLLVKLDIRPERGSGQITARLVRLWHDEIAAGHDKEAAIIYDGMFTDDERQRFSALPSDQARRVVALNCRFRPGGFPAPRMSAPKPYLSCGRDEASSAHVHTVPPRFTCHMRREQKFGSRTAAPTRLPRSPG